MKYIVSAAASLSFADGTKFELSPGIHDRFPEHVKSHWAFSAYVAPLNESDLEQEQQSADLSLRVAALEGEVTDLQKLLELEKDKVTELTDQRDVRDQTIDEHLVTIGDLQKLLELEKDKVTELTDQRDVRDQTIDEHLVTIGDLQKLLAEKEPVKEPDGEKGAENAKKQQSANK